MSDGNISNTQRAWNVVRRGVPSKALEFDDKTPVPSNLGPGEVLVKVKAAALNPIGYKLMWLLPNFAAARPFPAENDFSGVVADAGDSNLKVGDRVFGFVDLPVQRTSHQGSLAEYIRLPSIMVALLPPHISFTDGAGFAGSGVSAYQFLITVGRLDSGQSVFINGGSFSVGAYAIQIAKAKGCKVVASASRKNEEFVRALGADEFLDYTKASLHKQLTASPPSPKFHLMIDAIGDINPSLYTHSPAYLAVGGVFISSGPMPNISWQGITNTVRTIVAILRPVILGGTSRDWKVPTVSIIKEDLDALQTLIANGDVKPVIDSVFSFEDTLSAFDRIMTHRARGKVVVRVDSDAE